MKATKLLKSFKSANASKKEVREGGKENKQVITKQPLDIIIMLTVSVSPTQESIALFLLLCNF